MVCEETAYVITAYLPGPNLWDADLAREITDDAVPACGRVESGLP
jgi:hypothetical protein